MLDTHPKTNSMVSIVSWTSTSLESWCVSGGASTFKGLISSISISTVTSVWLAGSSSNSKSILDIFLTTTMFANLELTDDLWKPHPRYATDSYEEKYSLEKFLSIIYRGALNSTHFQHHRNHGIYNRGCSTWITVVCHPFNYDQ